MLAVAGLTASTAAAIGLHGIDGKAAAPATSVSESAVLAAPTVRVDRPAELSMATVTYWPGQSSGWHRHAGMHVVSIVSGTLTVYGPDCQPTSYGPGQMYVGGERVHLARDETDAPVEMTVTYLLHPGQSVRDFRVSEPAPRRCAVS